MQPDCVSLKRLEPPFSRVLWTQVLVIYQWISNTPLNKKPWTGSPKGFKKLTYFRKNSARQMIQIRAKSSWLHTQNFLNLRPEKPNRPVSRFWKEINSLMSGLLGRVPQTTVMVLAVVQADLVRPSQSRYDPVTGNSVN